MRQLATIRIIADIRPIQGADKIECALVDGWECVIAKHDGFSIGDKVVYIEIDSVVPDRPEFEFLRERHFRVRTIKLRGQVSQGLVLPLTVLPPGRYRAGDDVTEILGITKYDPEAADEAKLLQSTTESKTPLIIFLMRFKLFRHLFAKPKRKGGFPDWIVKTDEERIQNKVSMFQRESKLGTTFSVTEKIDGQSGTFFLERRGRKFEFGVCSRNIHLSRPDSSSYWAIARKYNIESVLKQLIGKFDRIVLQGEIVGPSIQGNKYKVNQFDFYAFNLIYPTGKVPTDEMTVMLKRCGIKSVPVVESSYRLPQSIADVVEYVKSNSVLAPVKREGCVFRSYSRNISFKCINPEFLLQEKD